jgi:purine-binding chemotaxis protein CheW
VTSTVKTSSGPEASTWAEKLAGKYLTFRLASEDYGLPILKVRELIGLMEVTRVPGAPSFVRGVINLRGRVIAVVDLRARFGLPEAAAGGNSVVIVMQIDRPEGALTIGALVDEVLEVREVAAAQIEPPPDFGHQDSAVDFILGISKSEKRVAFLLDIDRVLSSAEIKRLDLTTQTRAA